jgi:hypothetical protein
MQISHMGSLFPFTQNFRCGYWPNHLSASDYKHVHVCVHTASLNKTHHKSNKIKSFLSLFTQDNDHKGKLPSKTNPVTFDKTP